MSENVQRWMDTRDDGMVEEDDGEWVAYSDYAALAKRVEELEGAAMCSSCAGTGKPISGGGCMCGGTGRASDAVAYLLERVVDLESARVRLSRKTPAWQR